MANLYALSKLKSVDHKERRDRVIRATWRVISRQGIANATMREIAREAGCSSGVLAHYFDGKADIMASTMRAAHREVATHYDATKYAGLVGLREYMLRCLPLDPRRELLTSIEASFWGQAVGNDELVAIYSHELDALHARLRRLLRAAADQGEIAAHVDIDVVTRELHILIDGLSAQAALYPGRASNEEQIALLDAILDRIGAHAPRPAGP